MDKDQFRGAFQRFMSGFSEQVQGVIAIDGKVVRRSFDTAANPPAYGLGLGLRAAAGSGPDCHGRKIQRDHRLFRLLPRLLEMLTLKGTIVTADALNCQRVIAQQIVDQGGDHALAPKGNQGTLHKDVVLLMGDPATRPVTARPTVGQPRPHRDPNGHNLDEDWLFGRNTSMAGPGRCWKRRANPRDRR